MKEAPLDFQAFYQIHHRSYMEYAFMQSGSKQVSLDLLEVVFAQLLEDWPDVLREANVERYGFAVLRHAIATYLALTERPRTLVESASFGKVRAATRRQLEAMESSLGLYPAIARLPERQMDVIVFLFVLGYSMGAVARIMGICPATVRSHLHAARRQLAREVGVQWNDRAAEEVV
ncbi:RNA polymerase sigma factor [Streptomyces tsukubensis]|uniref:RNA polymerase sigma factor n=1 Tax=Streptomyces tsukubensis TaxID=83656 RepID=UPI00344F7179